MAAPVPLRSRQLREVVTVVGRTDAQIRAALAAGEWVKAGEVAVVLGLDPATVHRWRRAGRLRTKRQGGAGQHLFDPAQIRELLDEAPPTSDPRRT